MDKGWIGSLRGIVQTLEQKSGLNPLLFLSAIFGIPGLVLYSWKENSIMLWFAGIPLAVTVTFYCIAFFTDKDFLRSEKYVYDMKRLDVLGEKGKELSEREILEIQPITDPSTKKIEKSGGK